jgi:DNA-binding CsgD family transcriptional regulator
VVKVDGMAGSTEAALEFLEAAYAWEVPEERWLHRLAEAAARVWGRPRWAYAMTYDASDPNRFQFSNPVVLDGSAGFYDFLVQGMARFTPDMLARTFRSRHPVGFGRTLGVIDEESDRMFRRLDTADSFGINGIDASKIGCFVCLGAERTKLSMQEILIFQRLAYHMASAFRIRRRLHERQQHPLDDWEALVDPDGRLVEARGQAADPRDRTALTRAARSRELARSRGTDEPTERWRPRVSGRWTLIDAFSKAGRRYIVARENEVTAPGLDSLTAREQQVVASAAAGRSNKEIAYELGISFATVRVLLGRACARLGVHSRREMLELPILKALRVEVPESEPERRRSEPTRL